MNRISFVDALFAVMMTACMALLAVSIWHSPFADDAKIIDRAAVLLIESDIDAETRRAGVEALAELLRVRRANPD